MELRAADHPANQTAFADRCTAPRLAFPASERRQWIRHAAELWKRDGRQDWWQPRSGNWPFRMSGLTLKKDGPEKPETGRCRNQEQASSSRWEKPLTQLE